MKERRIISLMSFKERCIISVFGLLIDRTAYELYRVVHKKGNPHLAAILKYFLKVINLSVFIFGQVRLYYVSGEEIVEKDERMCLLC